MRPQKVLDIEIIEGLTKVFRSKGYDGASLSDLAEATGLKKASLYHRFPGGKKEMANAVLSFIGDWVENNVFKALTDVSYSPQERLQNGIEQIKTLYNYGSEVCVFRALSMESGLELFEQHISSGMQQWINTFINIGIALSLSNEESEEKALEVVIEIQGSLIVSKIMNNLEIFDKTLHKIKSKYI